MQLTALALLTATTSCISDDSAPASSSGSQQTTTTAAAVVDSSGAPASTTTSSTVDGETTSTSTTIEADGVTRPYVDPAICEASSASEGSFSDLTLTLFALSREAPIPIQIIGDPDGDSFDAFALIERFFASNFEIGGTVTLEINGNIVGISTYGNGNGEARWKLPDGSLGYLRSRGLDQTTLESILQGLSPRDPGAVIPGFDFSDAAADATGLALLHEHLNTNLVGRTASVECVAPDTGFIYRIGAIDADPIVEYGGVIDRPVPLQVGERDGIVIVIDGAADPSAPTLTDIVNADLDTWTELLATPPP